MLAFWEGGLTLYGGVILALVACYAALRVKGLSFRQTADRLGPTWVLLLVAGRIGCFLNGCCYGRPTALPWGLTSEGSALVSGYSVPTHPTQLYSALWGLIVFGTMWAVRRRPKFTGQVGLVFCLLHPVGRFFIEYFRADPRGVWRFFGAVTLSESQILSLLLFLLGLVAWRRLSRAAGDT